MAYAVTDAWLAAVNGTKRRLYLLVELLGIGRFFSNASWGPGGPWTSEDGALSTTGLVSDAQHSAYEPLIARLDDGGVASITEEIDLENDSATIGQAGLKLINTSLLHDEIILSGLENTAVRIRLGIGDGLGHADMVPLFYGFLDSWQASFASMELSVVAGAFRWHRDLSAAIGQYLPGAPDDAKSQPIPLAIGYNSGAQAIRISQDAIAKLAFAIGTSELFVLLVEANAGFPEAGTISIASETGITYTGRQFTVVNGQMYLVLTGLTRGSPSSHAANATVTLTGHTYDFLMSYDTNAVDVVREDGVVITSGFSIALHQDIGAERNVGLLRFTALPSGTITVDAESGNIEIEGAIQNGGFETGTASGWSTSGGSTSVTTGDTAEGTYKAELEGTTANVDATLSQSFATRIGQLYILEFQYRDNDTATGLIVTDGVFVNGLASWTVGYLSANAVLAPVNTYELGPGIELRATADTDLIEASFYQDITVVATTAYLITFYGIKTEPSPTIITVQIQENGVIVAEKTMGLSFVGSAFNYTAGASSARIVVYIQSTTYFFLTQLIRPPRAVISRIAMRAVANFGRSTSSYVLGTSGDEDAYGGRTLPRWTASWRTENILFTATDTSATIKLRSQHDNASAPEPSWFDGVRLIDRGRNAIDVIRYIIQNFVPGLGIDEPSFLAAQIARSNWVFNGQFRNPGNSRALLDDLANQCACRRIEDGQGLCKLVPVDYDTASLVYGFDTSNIIANSVTIRPEPIETVFTEVYIYYGLRSGQQPGNPSNYTAVVWATPKDTTHQEEPLNNFCAGALNTFGFANRRDVFADAIFDITTAHLLLSHIVRQRTARRYLVSWSSSELEPAYLELGDLVQINHPLLPSGIPGIVEIVRKSVILDGAHIQFTGRFARPASVTEEWDLPTVFTLGFSVVEQWDATFVLETGEGVTEEWDT